MFMYTARVCVHELFQNTKPGLQAQLVWFCFVVAESGHAEHCAAAPRENVLPLHASQVPSPSLSLYVPGAHPTQFPTVPVYPALHTIQSELPAADDDDSGQASHCAAPGTDENVFSGHSVHGSKSLSGLLNLPGAHRVHCVAIPACNV
jgi:hypothetical protein